VSVNSVISYRLNTVYNLPMPYFIIYLQNFTLIHVCYGHILPPSPPSLRGEISQKREMQNSKFRKRPDFRGFQWPKVRETKNNKNCQIHIFGYHWNTKRWKEISTLFLVYNQIWLNLPRDGWSSLFLHLFMDDCHVGYKQKFLKKPSS